MQATATIFFLVALVPLCGAIMAATPWLMPKNECFAVTVPESAQNNPQIRSLKRSFATRCLVLTAIGTALTAAAGIWMKGAPGSESAAGVFIATLIAATLASTLIPFAFMLRARKRVMTIKKEQNWNAPRKQTAAVVLEDDLPHAISFAWNLLYIPVLFAIVAIGAAVYPHMPDMIPMHADFEGNVNRYAPKSIATVFGFPIAVVVFMAVCFAFSHWGMLRSKRPTNPDAPATSTLAYGLFARAQSIYLLVTGLLISSGIGIGFMLTSAGIMSLGQFGVIMLAACIPVIIGAIALSFIYGQSGSRLFLRLQSENDEGDSLMPADDDEHWKLGIFYFNSEDPSIWLPERFGIGWTLNLARPAAWALIAGFVTLTVAMVAVCVTLAG